jgi:hypothetical protein
LQSSTCIALPFTCQSQRNGSRRWKWKCSCLALLQLASCVTCVHIYRYQCTTERRPFPDLCFLHTLFRGPVSTHRFFYRRLASLSLKFDMCARRHDFRFRPIKTNRFLF